jgi:hypothetical protein
MRDKREQSQKKGPASKIRGWDSRLAQAYISAIKKKQCFS